jgi:hypothetical protein
MSTPRQVHPWRRGLKRVANFLFSEGGIGLAVAASLLFGFRLKQLAEIFRFPPQDQTLAMFLVSLVAFSAWVITRSCIHSLLSLDVARDQANTENQTSGKQNHDPSLGHAHSQLQRRGVKRFRKVAGAAILTAVLFFFAYMALSYQYVSTPRSEASVSPALPAFKQVASTTFFHPLLPSREFKNALPLRGGYEFVVDNDSAWLEDALKNEPTVAWTRILILASALAAVAALIVGTTLLSSLPTPSVSAKDLVSDWAGG